MKVRVNTLHTSQPLEVHDAESKFARNFEIVLGLPENSVSVVLEEFEFMQPCKINPEPHCHYTVTTRYDETQVPKSIDKE